MKIRTLILNILFFVTVVFSAHSQSSDLNKFPKGSQPEEIGAKLVEHLLQTPFSDWGRTNSKNKAPFVTYPDVCAWLGALWLTKATNNDALYDQLVDRFDPLFTTQKDMLPEFRPKPHNVVDWYVFGAVPLEIYKKEKAKKYLDLGLAYADKQWILPDDPRGDEKKWHNQGYSWQTRLWIDDMFMITAVQAQAYLVTGDKKYINRAVDEMALYLDNIQRPNGLFYHAPNAPFFWGRGNGWMAVGMTEMLRLMPKDNPNREKIETAYKSMMQTLLRYQSYDGMWHQLIDDPNSWKETSCTGMFTYAMITGVKNGWLDKKVYGAAARKGWSALLTYLDEDYNLRNVCEGTGTKNDYNHYLNRKKLTGDLHGQAALIWCSYALSK
ncbi:glycoside hydrolase family 105 protein [Flavivirga sp. 57AJ16]|uniref:glycoside hydrolase family 88/105 protein n=1 Tax=Flavivirga sp. 57AJ16 TaxID=3025307 RepID=UPI0023668C06|nr:glycoside hydrolase family 88 protein [Flavivirga sp. 57AJ16]MDD7887554.1 glycoside hydrolase family 88 protein [Flavivirga sp. 57AJ16]